MDRRNFLKGAAAGTSAIVMGGLLSACTQSTSNNEQESPKFTAGTYTATALGRTGNVTVETVFTDTEISSINVTENGNTEVISQPAVDLTPTRG